MIYWYFYVSPCICFSSSSTWLLAEFWYELYQDYGSNCFFYLRSLRSKGSLYFLLFLVFYYFLFGIILNLNHMSLLKQSCMTHLNARLQTGGIWCKSKSKSFPAIYRLCPAYHLFIAFVMISQSLKLKSILLEWHFHILGGEMLEPRIFGHCGDLLWYLREIFERELRHLSTGCRPIFANKFPLSTFARIQICETSVFCMIQACF